jgi:hypothetical protein
VSLCVIPQLHLFCHFSAPSPQRCAKKKSLLCLIVFCCLVVRGDSANSYVYALTNIAAEFIWHMQRFRSLVICSCRRAEEDQHRGYGKSPSEVHLAKIMLQLRRVLHVQVEKAAHSLQTLINMKLKFEWL